MLTYKPIKNLRIHRLTTTVSLLCGVFFLPTTAAAETAWERSNATSESYDFAVNDGSGSTYYNINLKNIDNLTWTSGSADASWNEGTGTATGSISFEIPHVIGDPSIKNYIYQYTLPTGYTETETRYANESGSGDEEATLAVNNKLFFNIEEAGQGGAVFLKSSSAHTYTNTIQSDFINNSTSHKWGGGAIAISGSVKINSITGNFIGNVSYNENAGALNLGTSQEITDITGNFIANRSQGYWNDEDDKAVDGGGAIYTKAGNRKYITGDFIGNSARRKGGAIYQAAKTIGTITGDFIANTAGENGGAIYTNSGSISNIIGNFINNQAGGSGGALYIGKDAIYNSIRGSFIGNIAASYGGAIYNNQGTVSIDATSDDGDIVFYNNKAGEDYSDIYNNGGTSTISLNAATGQKISFGGILRASSGTININNKAGVQGGTYIFNNTVSKNSVNLYSGAKLILGKITQTNGTITYGNLDQIASLTTDDNGGEINQINDHIDSNTINTVTLGSGGIKYGIDIDGTTKTADKITTSESTTSSGIITLEAINLIGGFESLTSEDVIQIINNKNASSTLKLQLGSELQGDVLLRTIEGSTTDETIAATTAWNKTYQRTIISDTEVYGQLSLKTKVTEDDSIGITTHTSGGEESTETMGDTLKLVNQDTINTTKNFTANQQGATYNLSDDLGATNGTVNINGVSGGNAETLNLASHQGFQVGDDATALNFNDVTVNSSSAIATVTNGSATIGVTNSILNGNIAASTAAYGLTLSGNNTINGTVGMANATMNDSNGGLIFNTDTFTNANTVNFTAGSINLGNTSSYDTYAINHLNSNANVNYTIDFDASGKQADVISATNNSAGTITLSHLNLTGDFTGVDANYKVQIINNASGSALQLALSDAVISQLGGSNIHKLFETTQTVTGSDQITATTNWNDQLSSWHREDTIEHYGTIGLTTTTTTNDSIGYIQDHETTVQGDRVDDGPLGDTLKLVNQDTINTTKNFTANQQGATYNLSDDLGATNGTVNINGVSGGNAETLNLASHQGFQVGDDATALNFDNVTVNSSSAIATVTNGSATIGVTNSILNGTITGDTAFNMTTSGTSQLNGAVTNANITNTGNLTTTAANIADSSITNSSNLYLSGVLAKTIAGTGTTYVNSTLTLNSGAEVAGTLNANSGTITVSNGTITSHDIGAINGNGNLGIDMNLSSSSVDTFNLTNASSGTLTLTSVNILDPSTTSLANDFSVQVLNPDVSSAIQLALSSDVATAFNTKEYIIGTTGEVTTRDDIQANTSWNKVYQEHTTTASTDYGKLGLSDDKQSIEVAFSRRDGGITTDTSLGDTLKLVNQDITNTTKDFTANQQGATYNLNADLGETKGTLNVNGIAGGAAETLNLNGHSFQVGADATALNFNNVTVGGASTIATVTNGSATIGVNDSIVNGAITGDTAFNMTTSGTSELNASVTNANITNTGNLTTTAANIAASNMTNSNNLYLSGALAQSIAGTGTTYVNSTLTLDGGAKVAGTLNANNGTITVSSESISSHDIGAISGNGNLAIDMNLSSSSVDTFNLTDASSGTLTLTSVNILDPSTTSLADDFSVQVLNPATSSSLKLALSNAVQTAFNSTEYIIGTSGATTSTDTIEANTAWNKVYQEHTTTASTDYGKLGLSDDKLSIEVAFSRRDGGTTTDTSLGDTLKLVNNDTTNATKNFTANQQGKTYNVSDDLGDTKGTLNIKGISGGAEETLNLNGHGFQLGEGATALNFDNVTVSGASTIANVTNGSATVGIKDSIINGTITGATAFNMTTSGTNQLNGSVTNANITNTGNLTTKNSTIGNSVVNNGTINLVNTIVNGDITNNGTLNLKTGTALTNAISSTNNNGVINVNNNWTLSNTISGNKINVNNSTLKVGSNYLDNTDTINAKNSKIDIGANTVNLKSMKLDGSSTLSLKINGLEDGQHGLLNITDSMTINSGAKLKATLAQGINYGEVTLIKAGSHNGDFADKDVSHTEEGVDVAENNMYKFIKTKGKFGVFSILQKSTAADVAKEQGARSWVANAAGAWVDEAPFAEGSSGAIAADKLAALAQHDAAGFVHNLKALAPTETAVVQNTVTEQNSILFKTVDSYLRNKQIGLLSSDEFSDVTAWGNPYLSDTKMRTRQNIDGSNSNSRGIIFGLEKELDRAYKFGAGLQIDRTDVDIMSRDIDINSVTGFVYGEYKPCRQFINGIISYGQSNYKEKKYALDDTYNARYDVWVASVASMAGYQFEYFTPEAGFRYYHIKRDRYTDSAAQKVSADNADILRGVISLRFAREIYDIRAEAYLGLTYDFMADKNNTHVYLSNGSGYVVDGDKLRRLGYETSLSFAKSLTENISAAVSYMGTYRSGYQEHTGMLSLRYAFE